MTDDERMDYHQEALLRLLGELFVFVGSVVGAAPLARLPLSVKRQVMRALLPIESAVRRMIFFLEQRLPETPPAPRKVAKRSRWCHPNTRANQLKKRREERARLGKLRRVRAAVFWLFDRKAYCPHTADPHRRPQRRSPDPRISAFDGSDPEPEPVLEKERRDPNDAVKLCRRMQAVMAALKDLPGQAQRLRRLLDKRRAEANPKKQRPTTPIRDGSPPGFRWDGKGDVFDILAACHEMAKEPAPPTV